MSLTIDADYNAVGKDRFNTETLILSVHSTRVIRRRARGQLGKGGFPR